MATPTLAHGDASVPIGVGTWAWGNQFLWGYDPAQDAQLQATFEQAVALGLRFFDTADSYGTGRLQGRSERLLGRFRQALAPEDQQDLLVATKLAPFPWRLGRGGLKRAFEASRARLGGRLERVQLHWSTARYAPWQESPLLDGLADLVNEGLVASLGLSNFGPRRLRQVHGQLQSRGVRLASLQVQCSLLAPRAIEPGGVADVCRELGIQLIAYSPWPLACWPAHPVQSHRRPAAFDACCLPGCRPASTRCWSCLPKSPAVARCLRRLWRSTGVAAMAPCRSLACARLARPRWLPPPAVGALMGPSARPSTPPPGGCRWGCRPTLLTATDHRV